MTATLSPTDAERRNFVRYTHTRQWPMLQRFPVADELHDELLAQMLRCPAETARGIIDDFAARTREAAAQMLTDDSYRAAVHALPFRPGERVVAVGDSITADRLGWFELLSASVSLAGTPSGELVNLGLSGNTTADVLERFDMLEAAHPSHVLLMLGTNDARSHGRVAGHRMVTASETRRNMRALIDLVVNDLAAAVTVITPPAVEQRRIDAYFAGSPVRWQASDVAEAAHVVLDLAPDVLDLHRLTEGGKAGDILEPDGVHPTADGQRLLLTHIVRHLAGSPAAGSPAAG